MAKCRNAVADGFLGIAILMYVLIDLAVIPVVTQKFSRALHVFWIDSGIETSNYCEDESGVPHPVCRSIQESRPFIIG